MHIKGEKDTWIDAGCEFLHSCLLASPQRRFAELFDREKVQTNSAVKESVLDSLAHFEPDLARWNWKLENPSELFERLILAPNLQAAYFYPLSHELCQREIKFLPDVLAGLARWMTGVEIYYSAKIGP